MYNSFTRIFTVNWLIVVFICFSCFLLIEWNNISDDIFNIGKAHLAYFSLGTVKLHSKSDFLL